MRYVAFYGDVMLLSSSILWKLLELNYLYLAKSKFCMRVPKAGQ